MTRLRNMLVIGSKAFLLVAIVAGVWLLLSPRPDLAPTAGYSKAIYDRDGRLLRLALAVDDRYRLPTALNSIAKSAIAATLLYEDQYFYSHPGVNPAALARAAWTTYATQSRPMGASTISMQLARMTYRMETRSVSGKLAQIIRALQIERHYSKDDILEAYLNRAPYGGNIEGIGTAALIYFDKSADELTLAEAFTLAVIAQNPSARNPSSESGYAAVMQARARLLALWSDAHSLSEEQLPAFDLPLRVRSAQQLPFHAPHFASALLTATTAEESRVTSTLDLRLQQRLESQLHRYAAKNSNRGIKNASALLIDYRTMDVLASVGSADFFDATLSGQVSGTTAKRSPGSTLKPFVYGLAIDRGIIHPMTLLKDAPKRFAAYTPENFDRGFLGPITATDALVFSRNVPAIELLANVGHHEFNDFLTAAGVTALRDADHYGLSMVLGGNELTMAELVSLYAMLANGGVSRPLRQTQRADANSKERLLSAEASYLVLDMLRQNPRPDSLGIRHNDSALPVAWKTGTSYAYRDAWSIGVFGPYVLAVWVGNFDGSSNPSFVGRTAAAPLFFSIVDALQEDAQRAAMNTLPLPELNLTKVEVCADTGDLAGRFCPRTETSWFIPGVSPITLSNVHRGVRVDSRSGKRSCGPADEFTEVKVYEFWPSDILDVFESAGVAVRSPPSWDDNCPLATRMANGIPPNITSPGDNLTYYVRLGGGAGEDVALRATTDADAEWLYWFADNHFIAKAHRDDTIFWRPSPGQYALTAIDDLGRTDQRHLTVAQAL